MLKNKFRMNQIISTEFVNNSYNHKSVTFVRNLSCLYCTQSIVKTQAQQDAQIQDKKKTLTITSILKEL
jgi:hypothetical protein